MEPKQRRKAQTQPLSPSTECLSPLSAPHTPWIPLLSTLVDFSLPTFFVAMERIILHPEHSSSTILRTDVLYDSSVSPPASEPAELAVVETASPSLAGYHLTRRIRRRILPSRLLDEAMEQECCFYEAEGGNDLVVLLLPDLELVAKGMKEGSKVALPYYHPQVAALAFRYSAYSVAPEEEENAAVGSLRLDLVPLAGSSEGVIQVRDRIYRTGIALLDQITKISNGIEAGYRKRVHHDLLSGKEAVQDLYMILKEKYRADIPLHSPRITFSWLLNNWKEVTDPQKHLWEDVAIAAWLIVVWRHMYAEKSPPGGFVDLGCGNGLLVFLLSSEGYKGYGIDLRERKSWTSYPTSTDLRVVSLSPIDLLSTYLSDGTPPFPPHSFLIGNHADELTPYVPLLSAATPFANFLNIPCCPHEFTDRFTRQSYTIPTLFNSLLPKPAPGQPSLDPSLVRDRLLDPFYRATAPELHTGRFFAYQSYLAHVTLRCGYLPEREALRIPSTKNFGFLGRTRVWDIEEFGLGEEEKERARLEVRREIEEIVQESRGKWKARKPEGNAGNGGH